MSTTMRVRATAAMMGLREGMVVEMADSPYLRLAVERGWLELVDPPRGDTPPPAEPPAELPADPPVDGG